MKTRTLFTILLCCFNFLIFAQNVPTFCYDSNFNPPNLVQPPMNPSCTNFLNYIPTPTSPILTYRLNYHFFNDPANPSGPFNYAADWPLIQQQINWINAMLANLNPPTLPVNPPAALIPNARIQFYLDPTDVYYHVDPSVFPLVSGSSCQSTLKNTYGVNVNSELNVFFYYDQVYLGGCGPKGSHVNMMTTGLGNPQAFFSWATSQLLLHELGHALGYLDHTMVNAQFSDITPDTQWGWIFCNNTTVSNNVMSYNICRDYLSPMQIGHWQYQAYNNVTTKFLTTCDYNAGNTVTIGADETWTTSKIVGGDLIIEPGITLTVQCNVFMPKTGKVIVKPNARLIIDGGVFTNGCGDFWQGIEVWGNSTQNQFPSSHPTYQGKLQMINGAIIEHAYNAVTLWKPGDWNSRGGVIVCNNAIFRNNKRAVEFISYHNTHPTNGTKYRNLSGFLNTQFDVNNNYRINSAFSAHVTMWDVEGISLAACNFMNNQSNLNYQTNSNKGIFSIDAGYRISGTCNVTVPFGTPCPPQDLNRTYFSGFNYAIHALGSGTVNTFTVDQGQFDNNIKGVEVEGLNNYAITRSNFTIGENAATNSPLYHCGIVSVNSTGYRIEENTFDQFLTPVTQTVRCQIFNSGINYNELYKNTFSDLTIAEWSLGRNRNNNNGFEGLQFLCNSHSNSLLHDIAVYPYNSPPTNDGVRTYQGEPNPSMSAGNIFSQINSDFTTSGTNWPIFYYHNGGLTEPIYYSVNVLPIYTTTNNICSSRFTNHQRFPLDPSFNTQLSNEYYSNKTAYYNILYNYLQLIDGGNTPEVLQEIISSWPQDAWDLRNLLLSYSPYLSLDVLKEACNRNILPNAMILEICLANPEGSRNEDLIQFMQYEMLNPMPQYMVELIKENWESESPRSLLERSLATLNSNYSIASDLLITDFKITDEISNTSIINLLEDRNSLNDNYQVTDIFIMENNYTMATNNILSIGESFNFNEQEIIDHELYLDYTNLRKSIYDAGSNISQLTPSNISDLAEVAIQNTEKTSVQAQNILCFFNNDCKEYSNILLSTGNRIGSNTNSYGNNPTASSEVIVSPNPSNNFTIFDLNISALPKQATIVVKEMTGKIIYTQPINSLTGQFLIDVSKFNDGLYIYEINNENRILNSGKYIVQH